tara:strand:+ start:3558 stop:3824 length:267 start_codon:yes stop_codon:yes gene_type:complete
MAEVLTEFEFSKGGRAKYNWGQLMNGQIWKISVEEIGMDPVEFCRYFGKKARQLKLSPRTQQVDWFKGRYTAVVVCAEKPVTGRVSTI